MPENDFRLEGFNKAETELLSAVQWMEDCKKAKVFENMSGKLFGKMAMIDIAFHVKANTCKLGLMFASLSTLAKTYNRQFASFMGKEKLAKVLCYFEEMNQFIKKSETIERKTQIMKASL